MTELALLPLETRTLPGWPQPPEVTGMMIFFVLLVIPALITLVIIAGVTVGQLARSNRATTTGVIPEHRQTEPEKKEHTELGHRHDRSELESAKTH